MLKDLNLDVLLKNLDKNKFLKELERLKYFKIKRISGASVGGYAGFLYLIDKLDIYIEEYELMKEGFRETLTLNNLERQLRKLVTELSDTKFKSLQKDRLYIRFFDIHKSAS